MAARKHIGRTLEECCTKVVPGVKEGFDLSVSRPLVSRPLLLPTFDALLQRHVGVGSTAGLDANPPRAQPAPDHSSYGTLNQHRITSRPAASRSIPFHSPDHFDSCTRPFQSYPIIHPLIWLPRGLCFQTRLESVRIFGPFPSHFIIGKAVGQLNVLS